MRRVTPHLRAIAALAAIAGLAPPCPAQLPFFSGAEGYGGVWSGSPPAAGWLSSATIYHVTNLNDSGPGSFRSAFQENSSNRIIVFDVGGTINITDNIDIKNLANYYIAGQTAPAPVTIYGETVQLTHSSNKENRNVVLRYLSFRKGTGEGQDALTFAGSGLGTNLILDHVSASWSEDEILSVANNNTNITVQYSMINDALVNNHAYGSLIRPRIDSNVTFHHNLYAHNASRQARFGTYDSALLTADFRNNVIYNWRDRASYAGGSSDSEQEYADVNYVGNYLIAGPGTTGSPSRAFTVDRNIDVRAYQAGNYIDSDRQPNPGGQPNGADTGWNMFGFGAGSDQTLVQLAAPLPTPPVTTQPAPEAYWQVVNHAGNWWWDRDAIDSRVVNNVLTHTGPPIGAANPNAAELAGLLSAPMVTRPPGWDTDNDGMPDAWELAHGLNPNSTAGAPDWKLDFDNDGYINLLEYLNEAGEFPAPAPIVFHGGVDGRYAMIMNWRTDDGVTAGTPWQPSKYDEAVIPGGSVVVDAVGQHAGRLQVAPLAGQSATLNVTSGWLDVAGALEVGLAGTGTVNHAAGLVLADEVALGGEGAASGAYHLSGTAVLRTGLLTKTGGSAVFSFTGGTLSAGLVEFDLTNQGGVISPGNMVGAMQVAGDLTIEAGVLALDIAGGDSAMYDTLSVSGHLTAGGMLAVSLVDYSPQSGDVFDLLDFQSASGSFQLSLPSLAQHLAWDPSRLLTTGELSVIQLPDFNGDMLVDSADLAVWMGSFGSPGSMSHAQGDADGNGAVDGRDFLLWQHHFGAAMIGPSAAAVPEPAAATLLLAAIALGPRAFIRRRSAITTA